MSMIHWKKAQIGTLTRDDLLCFDIEVSSFWIQDGKIYKYDEKKHDSWYNTAFKGSCVYIWMLSINDTIYYGREWNDFKIFLDMIKAAFDDTDPRDTLYIFVHNLSYETQFLIGLIPITKVFARTERKPIYLESDRVQFRCSYMLTNKSLATWGKEIGVNKKVGDLDYKTLRTPLTYLTDKELGYCEFDLRVMIAGLHKYIERYGEIRKIPLTATGEVRRAVNKLYTNNVSHHYRITKLQPNTPNKYAIYRSIFGGGDCHTHIIHSCELLENVGSEDATSDYPYQLVSNMYPSTAFAITMETANDWDFEKNAYIFHLKLTGIKSKGTLCYLAYSRCKGVQGLVNDNGRIYSADEVDLWCTEQEYGYIHKLYNIEDEEIIVVYKSRKKYLDSDLINFTLDLYYNKTMLKGAESPEDIELYMCSKALLNSLYGLCVQDIIQSDVMLENGIWSHTRLTPELLIEKIAEVQEKKYKNNMAYTTGIWCTAYARAFLWDMIIAVNGIDENSPELTNDVCYYDTDSVKFLHPEKHMHKFVEKNKEIEEKLRRALEYHNIPFEKACPSKNDKKYLLGAWDFEGIYKKCKFMGAKKYAYEDDRGEIHITVSGVPKVAAKCLKSLDDFHTGFVFDREICNKNQSSYIDGNNYTGYMPDGYYLNQPYGLNIRPCGYTLDLTNDYKTLINFLKGRG